MKKCLAITVVMVLCVAVLSACSPKVADHTQNKFEVGVNEGQLLASDVTELVVGSYNLKAFGKIDPSLLASTINSKNIDIVGLQEVDRFTKRNPRDVLSEIAGASSGVFGSTYYSNAINFEGGNYGLGTMSRFKYSTVEYNHYLPNYKLEDKLYQRMEFSIGDKTLAFYNTHLNYEKPKSVRESQIAHINDVMNKDTADYKIVVGDFNTEAGVEELKSFNDGYKMASTKENPLVTFPEEKGLKSHLDNIIVSDNINFIEIGTVQGDSDHMMLFAKIKLM